MGISLHEFNFLRYAKQFKPFDRTVTIGRQKLHVAESTVRDSLALDDGYRNDTFCEKLLMERFGATGVDSIDASDYEGASVVYDMNLPSPESFSGRYDTVIDGGCLEHIYNVPQALHNCSAFCRPGGQILHMLPANNCCGHGFWQFSPELFFSLYSRENGYTDTEVFLADLSKTSKWFRVKRPAPGERVNVKSMSASYVMVRTVLLGTDFNHASVQQSDYVFEWQKQDGVPAASLAPAESHATLRRLLRRFPLLHKMAAWVYHLYRPADSMYRLSVQNPHLEEMRVSALTGHAPR